MPANRPVQMRPGYAARGSAETNALAHANLLAFLHIDPRQMHRKRKQAQPVVDHDAVSFVVEWPREHDYAAITGLYRRACSRTKIHPFVDAGQSTVEDAPGAEAVRGRCGNGRMEIALPKRVWRARRKDLFFQLLLDLNLDKRFGSRLHKLGRNGQLAGPVVSGMNHNPLAQVACAASVMHNDPKSRKSGRSFYIDPGQRKPSVPVPAAKELHYAPQPFAVHTGGIGSIHSNQFRRAGLDNRRGERKSSRLRLAIHRDPCKHNQNSTCDCQTVHAVSIRKISRKQRTCLASRNRPASKMKNHAGKALPR